MVAAYKYCWILSGRLEKLVLYVLQTNCLSECVVPLLLASCNYFLLVIYPQLTVPLASQP